MKRLLTIMLSAITAVMASTSTAKAAISHDWDSSTHTLTINGSGAMDDYTSDEGRPWNGFADKATTVIVGEGVTRLGDNAFANFNKLAYISLPSTLTEIGDFAFANTNPEQLVLPEAVTKIGRAAFLYCQRLRSIYLGGNITQMGGADTQGYAYGAFAYCDVVSDIYFYQHNLSGITWYNDWEFKDGAKTRVHVYNDAALPTGINCNFVTDIPADLRALNHGSLHNSSSPYEISEEWQLDFITAIINSSSAIDGDPLYLKLVADLEFNSAEENNFTPIGTYDHSFKGVFDGNGKIISGININTDKNYVGFFSYVSSGTVKNIKFKNIHITTTGASAGVIGGATYSNFENITIENSSFQADINVGPLVGFIEEAGTTTVKNCHVKTDVTVKAMSVENVYSNVGGLIGRTAAGSIIGCSSGASVYGPKQYVAGLVGYNKANITDCIYLGTSITCGADTYCRALSDNVENPTPTVSNCLFIGELEDDFASRAYNLTSVEQVSIFNEVTHTYGTSDFPGITVYEGMMLYDGKYYVKPETVVHLSYSGIQWFKANDIVIRGYQFNMPAEDVKIQLFAWEGSGTESDPYLIYTVDDLDFLSYRVNYNEEEFNGNYFKVINDITYDGSRNNYIPIGYYNGDDDKFDFNGTFDGNGKTISGISYIASSSHHKGLFGQIGSDGTVKNVTLANSYFLASQNVGGIAGSNYGTIENCHVENDVQLHAENNESSAFGGIAGYSKGPVLGCTSAVTITKGTECNDFKNVGGIVGYEENTVNDCLFTGTTLEGTEHVGAIIGCFGGESDVTNNLGNNYYTSASLCGCDGTDIIDNNGAVKAYTYLCLSSDMGDLTETYGEGTDFEDSSIKAYQKALYYKGTYYSTMVGLNLLDDDHEMAEGKKNTDIISQNNGSLFNVTLQNRKLYRDCDWNTLCLPFDAPADKGVMAYSTVMKLIQAESHLTEDGTLVLNFETVTDELKAGTPYIVKWENLPPKNVRFISDPVVGFAGEESNNLFDGDPNTKWYHEAYGGDGSKYFYKVYFYASSPIQPTGYVMTTGNDIVNHPTRSPFKWVLEGQTSAEGWVTIDSHNAVDNPSDALPNTISTGKTYMVDEARQGEYQYFCLTLYNSDPDRKIELGEFTMLVKANDEVTNPTFESVTINNMEPADITLNDESSALTGIYNTLVIPGEDKEKLFMGANNTLYYPNAAMNLNAFRAYFKLLNGVHAGDPATGGMIKSVSMNFGEHGSATGILQINDDGKLRVLSGDGWYDMSGRRLNGTPTVPGLYLNNGKKVYIK